ncbi:MAG TPA: efflux RND transporter periplasmic adaptor subunit [Rhodospirillaceae bacterium]|nr:efflux RND transporter periplasmic adaptor subunit [Rhodospirillaceae bacterium]
MKILNKVTISFIALIAIGAAAYIYMGQTAPSKAATGMTIATASRGSIESLVTAQGTLEPKTYVDVGAQVSGQIQKLHVAIGDTVKAGDLIAEIDSKTYESVIAGDEAQLAQLEAQKQEKKATMTQSQRDMGRNQKLVKESAISKSVYDQSQTDYEVAKAQLAAIEAQIKQQQSTLDKDKTNLTYTKIFAPFDGTVVDLAVKEGETVNANQTTPTIGRVANLDVMTAQAQVAEADIPKLKTGMNVYFTTLGSDGRRWTGTVRQILPTPQTVNDVVLYNILVDIENTDRALMTGMTTQMFFEKGSAKDVVTIPSTALLRRDITADTDKGTAYIVKVPSADGRPTEKTVIVGLSDRSAAEIISGLNEGDKVVIPTATTSSATPSKSTPPRMSGRL